MSDSLRPHGHQAPPSMGFSRQEYWSGVPVPSPGNFRDRTQVSHTVDRRFPSEPPLDLSQKAKKRELENSGSAGCYLSDWTSLVAQMVKNTHVIWEKQVQALRQEDPLEKGMAIHCNILAWRIPWTEEPGGT